jgi:integrase
MYQRFRISGEGTIERRSKNTYRIRFSLGRDHLTGKYRYSPWRTVRGAKCDARRALEEYRREIEGGLRIDLRNITFGEYAHVFLSNRENSGTLAKGTIETDRSLLKALDAYLGTIRIVDIDTMILINIIARMKNEDQRGEKVIHDLVTKIKQIMREAMLDGIIIRNPCDRIKTPKEPKAQRNSLKDYEAGRLLQILDASCLDRNVIAVYIGLASGMRRGEVLGLTWGDVDFYGQAINVTHTVDRWKIRKAPKGTVGSRRIAIDEHTLSRLKAWKPIQAEMLIKQGIAQQDTTPVCANSTGGICEMTCFYNWFTNFCVDNGFGNYVDEDGNVLPKRRLDAHGLSVDENGRRYSRSNKRPRVKKSYQGLKFHELRHTHATLLIANKVDIKTVQERLGHARASTTLDIYVHADDERDRQAANLFSSSIISAGRYGQRVVNF